MSKNHKEQPEFSDDQLRAALKQIGKNARAAAFAAGRSIMIVQNEQLVLQQPDGSQKVVGRLPGDSASQSDQ